MWTSEKSAKLTLYLTDVLAVIVLAIAVGLPWITDWYIAVTEKPAALKSVLLTVCYIGLPAALILLYALRRLLKNIMNGIIFDDRNVSLLRLLSWCCVTASLITIVAGHFYLPFFIVGVAAGFFAVILRVIKNVFRAAIDIKTENELTI